MQSSNKTTLETYFGKLFAAVWPEQDWKKEKSKGNRYLLPSHRQQKNVMFHGEMHDNIIMRKDKKNFCAAARSFWPEARFWDFFGLKKAEGLLMA